tara:strand:+ start:7141 stop:7734 length:594 start_codon:yes stop_codon:yes gene_type:complete
MIPFPTEPFELFIDVGLSYSAPHSQEVLAQNPNAFVIGIEPNPNSCSKVRALNLGDRFHLIEAGVGDVEGELDFNIIGPDEGTSSFLNINDSFKQKGYDIINQVKVSVTTLESILDEVPWDRVTGGLFDMKSDTQGYEDKVILGMGKYVKNVKTLEIEVQTWGYYDGASDHKLVKSLLNECLVEVRNDGGNAWFKRK